MRTPVRLNPRIAPSRSGRSESTTYTRISTDESEGGCRRRSGDPQANASEQQHSQRLPGGGRSTDPGGLHLGCLPPKVPVCPRFTGLRLRMADLSRLLDAVITSRRCQSRRRFASLLWKECGENALMNRHRHTAVVSAEERQLGADSPCLESLA